MNSPGSNIHNKNFSTKCIHDIESQLIEWKLFFPQYAEGLAGVRVFHHEGSA